MLLATAVQADSLLSSTSLRADEGVLDLGRVLIGHHTLDLLLHNDSDINIALDSLICLNSAMFVSSFPDTIAAGDSSVVSLGISCDTDLDQNMPLLVQSAQLLGPAVFVLSAQPRLEDTEWDDAANLWGEDLMDELADRIQSHTVFSYTGAREHMFGEYDNHGGQVECVYTGMLVTTQGIPDHTIMNCEHTWPQSMGAEGDARSDMFHLYPTDSDANSRRGNYAFGDVVNSSWNDGGSSLGTNASGATVFEPRDVHKGNCARSMFYFALCYGNRSNFLNSQEDVLRAWSDFDPVDEAEREREAAIAALQNNHNPFILNPRWLDRIASLANDPDPEAHRELLLSESDLEFGDCAIGDTLTLYLPLYNPGHSRLNFGYITCDTDVFSLQNAPVQLDGGDAEVMSVLFHPESEGDYEGMLSLSSNAQNGALRTLNLIGSGTSTALPPIEVVAQSWQLDGIRPNPCNPSTIVDLSVSQAAEFKLSIYDLRGALVSQSSQHLAAGNHALHLDLGNQASGMYLLSIEGAGQSEVRRINLLR